MYESLDEDYELWSDFETAVGDALARRCLEKLHPKAAYRNAYNHFVNYLFNSIERENDRASKIAFNTEHLRHFQTGAVSLMADGLSAKQSGSLHATLDRHETEHWNIRFISFNYTTLLDRIISETKQSPSVPRSISRNNTAYNRILYPPLHIHGAVTDNHGILMGIDNPKQIGAAQLAEDESIRQLVIKPMQNEAREDLAQEKALDMISKSTFICVFGMSLGKSDQTWWKAIGSWLRENPENRRLIIHSVFRERDVTPASYAARIRNIREIFLERAGIQDVETHNALMNSILISENTNAFNLGLKVEEA